MTSELNCSGEAGGMNYSGAAKIGMVDLAVFGTVLNQHMFNKASSKM